MAWSWEGSPGCWSIRRAPCMWFAGCGMETVKAIFAFAGHTTASKAQSKKVRENISRSLTLGDDGGQLQNLLAQDGIAVYLDLLPRRFAIDAFGEDPPR